MLSTLKMPPAARTLRLRFRTDPGSSKMGQGQSGTAKSAADYSPLNASNEEEAGLNVNNSELQVVPLSDTSDSDDSAELLAMDTMLCVNNNRNKDDLPLLEDAASISSEDDVTLFEGVSVLPGEKESFLSVSMQIFFPFLVAGMGMVAAGLVLDVVQHWKVFQVVSELFILVPALLGLKGNLEMTLASRLSTHANLGNLDSRQKCVSLVVTNLFLIQSQAIVVALVASLFAILMDWMKEGESDFDHALLLCASSLVTASFASFVLGLVMVGVILLSRKCQVNPDNVATPIAAALGDLTTLVLLSWIASVLFADLDEDKWLAPVIVFGYLLIVLPICVMLARTDEDTVKVLKHGWSPVLSAMAISSFGGLMLDQAVSRFDGIAVFQPVMNGVGGNLVAVQASRISTHLHATAPSLGVLPDGENKVCIGPCGVFSSTRSPAHARTALILLLLVAPGHLLFTYAIALLEAGHTSPTIVFLTIYLSAALLQVWLLLHTAHWLVHWLWKLSVNPDDSAIPYLTALGDLLGGALLWLAFELLYLVGDKDADVGD